MPRSTNPIFRRLSPFIIATIETYLALARHDTSDVLRRFDARPDSLCPDCFYTDQLVRLDAYSRVVEAWVHADTSLQPFVAEARNGLKRLTGDVVVREKIAAGRVPASTRTPPTP